MKRRTGQLDQPCLLYDSKPEKLQYQNDAVELGEIQKLYDIEDRAREMTDSQRLALRQAESRPIVTGIRAWLDERDREELPRSPLREGVNYLRNRWEAFERFLEDGAIPIDNKIASYYTSFGG